MKYNIHYKINFKELFKGKKFNKNYEIINDHNDFAANYSIYLHNKTEQNKMINSGNCYCSDCSLDFKKRITHYNYNPSYIKFINKENSNLDILGYKIGSK